MALLRTKAHFNYYRRYYNDRITKIIVDFAETVVSLKVKGYGKEEIEKYILDYRSKF